MSRQRKLPSGMWKRGNTYYARFRANGRLVRERLSTDYRAACQMLNDLRARADKADFGMIDNDYPWAKLRDEFIAWAKQSLRCWIEYERDIRSFEKFAPIQSVREVDEQRVIAFRRWRLDQGVSPRTVNREVSTVKNMLNRGVQWRRIHSNAIAKARPLANDSPRKVRRSLTLEEVEQLFEASDERLKPVWRMFMCTGIRHDELVTLTFSDIDFERKIVAIRASVSKNKKGREIPLDDNMLEMLTSLKEEARHRQPARGLHQESLDKNFSRDHVFVTRANTPLHNNLLRSFYRTCRKAGIEDARYRGSVDIHSLCVTFTTLALENGAPPKAVQAILGHSTLALTMGVYARATDRAMRAAVSALPFATASQPDHVISMQSAHNMSTKPKLATETSGAERVKKGTA